MNILKSLVLLQNLFVHSVHNEPCTHPETYDTATIADEALMINKLCKKYKNKRKGLLALHRLLCATAHHNTHIEFM